MRKLIRKLNRVTCKDVSTLGSKQIDGQLALADKFWLYVHLSICPACVQFIKQLKFLRQSNQNKPDDVLTPAAQRLSDESRERIRQKLENIK